MTHAGCKDNGLAPFAVLEPMLDDVADQLRPVHAVFELALDVVASPRLNATQIRLWRSVDARRHEEPETYQFLYLRPLYDAVKETAEPATIAARGCRRETKPQGVRVGVHNLLIGASRGVVSFIDHAKRGWRQLHHFCAD